MKLVGFTREEARIDTAQRIDATFEAKSGESISMFFEVAGARAISQSAIYDCLYLIGSTIAYWFGDKLIEVPGADKTLHTNVHAAHGEWNQWSGSKGPIQHVGDFTSTRPSSKSDRSPAVFFSGGVDSYFTLLNLPETALTLLSIEHAEPDQDSIANAFSRLTDLQNSRVDKMHDQNIKVVTNMMVAHPRILDQWALRLHGPFYAACALLVSDSISSAAISSTFEYGHLKPWGSHPALDPLWSSTSTQIKHFGADHSRAEKTELVARSTAARASLSVCERGRYADGSRLNCSQCTKCSRTMLTLDALGYTPKDAPAFDWTNYSLERVQNSFVHGPGEARLLREVVELANQNQRSEIGEAIEKAIRRSRALWWTTNLERWVRRKFPGLLKHKTVLQTLKHRATEILGFRHS